MSYYDKNISGNNSIDALYYVADDINNVYDNYEGGVNQKNAAHLVELISALAIVDFVNNINNRLTPTIHKEFGINDLSNGINDIILSDFAKGTENIMRDSLMRMFFFIKYNRNCREKQYEHQPWAIDRKLDKAFFSGNFYRNIEMFQNDFFAWLGELSSNNRKLTMFELGDNCDLFESVKDYKPKKKFLEKKNYALIDSVLNKQEQKGTTKEQLYMNLFYSAMKEVVSQKF
ncbi:MAG: hypothetical protein IKU01_04255 [Bacteroidales bacterium]|nr:hypothetical protein [Bacteroidales bacterium]